MGQSLGAKDEKVGRALHQNVPAYRANFSNYDVCFHLFWSNTVAGMYTDNVEIIQNTIDCIINRCVRSTIPKPSINYFWALRGAGDTVWPLIAIFIGSCVIRLSLGYVFVNFFEWGLAGAWYAVFIDQFIRDMIILLRFRKWTMENIKLHRIRLELPAFLFLRHQSRAD